MSSFCFTQTPKHTSAAEKIVSLSKKNYNPMSTLSTVYPYILREYARVNKIDINNVDQDELFDGLNEDWGYGWKEFCEPYVKALDNFKRVDFSNARRIIQNRLIDNESYVKLLEKYDLHDNKITDSKGNDMLYEDIKMQLLAKVINKKLSKEDAESLGYKKDSTEEDYDANTDLALVDQEPTIQPEEQSVFELNFADKPLNLQINDIKFKMSAKERIDAVNRIAHGFMNYIDKYTNEFNNRVNDYAREKDVSVLRAKWEIDRNNENFRRRIRFEQSLKNPDESYIDKWKSQIIPLNEQELINLYTAKQIANKIRNWFASKPEFSIIYENFDPLFIEAASIINNVYNINLLGNTELYDNFADDENINDPSESNAVEDAPKTDYSHADDKTKASEASLTKKVKRAYTKCFNTDSNGNRIPINVSVAHNKVLHLTQGMIDKDDLIPMLSKSNEQWVKQFVDMVKSDENLFKQLYRCIKLSAQDYRIIYRDKKDGLLKQKSINMDDASNLILKEAVANVDNGIIQGDKGFSLYDEKGYIDRKNIEILVNFIEETRKKIRNTDLTVDDLNSISKEVTEILKDLGITVPASFNFVESVLSKSSEESDRFNVVNDEFFKNCLQITDNAFKATKDTKSNVPLKVDGESSYKNLCNFISNSAIGYTENVTNEQGKSYYTYAKTNYFDELILKIKRSVKNKKAKNGNDFYKDFIDKQFKCSEFFYDSSKKSWRSDWMSKLFDNSPLGVGYRNIFKRSSLLYTENVEFLDWDETTAEISSFLMYRQGEDFTLPKGERAAWYRMPIASDSPAGDYIRFVSYIGDDYQDKIYDKFWDICKQELVRMNDVDQHLDKTIAGNSVTDSISSYDAEFKDNHLTKAGGLVFTLLPHLNYIKINTENYDIFNGITDIESDNFVDIIRHLENKKTAYNLTDDDLKKFFKEVYNEWFENDVRKEYDKVSGLITTLLPQETVEGRFNAWKNYSLNTQLAFTQIVELTSTDLAFFGDRKVSETSKEKSNFKHNGKYYKIDSDDALDKFQKRNKEYHAPTNKIATSKEFYKEVYIDDIEIKSQILENIEHIITDNKFLSSTEKRNIIRMYTKPTNVADGQAYRSLTSYKEMLKDFGELEKDVEDAFDRIINTHQWDMGDLRLITLAIKPYMYSVIPTDRDTERLDGSQNKITVPTQHKNSEYPILAALGAISLELKDNTALKALSKFMDKNKIDIIQFNSAVKVGEVGVATIKWDSDMDSIVDSLDKYCGFDISEDGISTRVHQIPTSDWGEQQKKPEHLIDKQQLVGSQPRRLILADIPDTNEDGSPYIITVNGKPYTKEKFVQHYQKLISENILEDFREVNEIFKDPRKLGEFLREQIASSSKYDTDLMDMFTWNQEENRFNIPFWDQSIANRVEELLNGLIRNRISKQKMRGGSAVQTASVGMTNKLNVRYKDENGNPKDTFDEFIAKNPDKNKDDYEAYLGDARLDCMECLLPMWSKDIMDALTSENGTVNFDRLPKELRDIIGYRIPTEDHYSMAPLRVVGFMPTMGASSIMLPADITRIAGSDFDVDVMYLLLKEFNVKKINMKAAVEAYNSTVKQKDRLGDSDVDKLLSDIFKDNYIIDEIISLEEPTKNRRFAIWLNRHEDEFYLAKKDWSIAPVEYDYSKTEAQNSRKARNNEIIDCMFACLTSKHSIEKFSNPGNYEAQKHASRVCECLKLRKDKSPNTILNAKTEELEQWIAEAKSQKNIGSPLTAVELHQQNAVGVALKGIFAAANATQQLFEYAKVQNNIHFTINWNNSNRDNEQWIIGRLRDRGGNLITERLAGYLDAAVDNGKDPIMGPMLIDKKSANTVVYLILLGYNPLEISLLMNCANNARHDQGTLDSIKDYKYNKAEDALDIEQMAISIQYPDTLKGQAIANHARETLDIISKSASLLGSFTQLMRADSVQGNVGKSMFDNMNFVIKYNRASENNIYKNFYQFSKVGNPLMAPEWPMLPFSLEKQEDIQKHINSANVPYLQAFIDCTIGASYDWIGQYSLLENPAIFKRIYSLTNTHGYVNEKIVKKYLGDLECWSLNQTKLFGADNNNTLSEKKTYYATQFPKEFQRFKRNLPDELKNNVFIDNIIVVNPNRDDKYLHLEVKDLGISKSIRDQFKSDFMQLAQVNPEMAMKLFVYTVYRNGLGYSQNGFSHLIPSAFKKSLPEYIDNLYNLKYILTDDDFFEQFVRNNYKTFYALAPDIFPVDKKFDEQFYKRVITDAAGYNYIIGYTSRVNRETGDKELFKMVVDSPNIKDPQVRDTYRLVKLDPLGMGKLYHDYDTNGGIKVLKDNIKYNETDQEDPSDNTQQQEDLNTKNVNIDVTQTREKLDKETLPESSNRTDEAGNPQC